MIGKTHTDQIVLDSLEYFLNLGYTDKHDIYTKVQDATNVPRPTIRRIARDLRTYYMNRIEILKNDLPQQSQDSVM